MTNILLGGSDVRFGSLADILRCGSDVRFTPESGLSEARAACPLSANSGHQPHICSNENRKTVYDPNTSTGSVAIQATPGTFRFVAGSQGGSYQKYQIKTPYGTLGVRGGLVPAI